MVFAALAAGLGQTGTSTTAEAEEVPDDRTPEERMEQLEDEVAELKERLRQHEELPISRGIDVEVGGYVDFGFFVPQGDGAGFIQDYSNDIFPEYRDQFSWVFLGDILATTVNSRGEVADLGNSPGRVRFDSIDSRGALGFLLNEANVTVRVGFQEAAILTTSINFVPRTGKEFALGDFFDLDLAQLEWVVSDAPAISLFAGKIEPVFGIEYKQRKADHRFGITPSLAQRYTSGTELGLKARAKLFDQHAIFSAAVTNGSSTIEQFHFYDEVDSNSGKTASGRAALHLPFSDLFEDAAGAMELGVSGEVGPQDRARDNDGLFWLAGADLELAFSDFAFRAEAVIGRSPGRAIDDAFSLRLKVAGYAEINWMLFPWLGVLARGDLRDAFVTIGSERAYLTKSWRATGGLRFVFSEHVLLKLEYLHNGEYGGIPQIKNDVFTSSLLVEY